MEIFGYFGVVKSVDLPNERNRPWMHRGNAYIEFEKPEECAEAVKKMDRGKTIVRLIFYKC